MQRMMFGFRYEELPKADLPPRPFGSELRAELLSTRVGAAGTLLIAAKHTPAPTTFKNSRRFIFI